MTDLEIAEWVGFYYGLQRAGDMHVAHTTDEAGRTLNALRRLIQAEMDKTKAKLPPGALRARWIRMAVPLTCRHAHWESEAAVADGMCPICLAAERDDLMKANALLHALIGNREAEIERLRADLRRLWHFAGCPFDHCQTCIDDAEWIKSLEDRLGPPSANSVIAGHRA